MLKVLPLTREWIEISGGGWEHVSVSFSLLRGSGLKCLAASQSAQNQYVLPLTREWIEIASAESANEKE